MNPVVTNLAETDGVMTFTLSGVNVSLANALDIVLSDIHALYLERHLMTNVKWKLRLIHHVLIMSLSSNE